MFGLYDSLRDCTSHPFLIAPYHPRDTGEFLPDLPTSAPCRRLDGACHIVRDHLRERKTGPEHPILVIRCLTHERKAFSVYPLAFTPHGRERIAPFGPDGALLVPAPVEDVGDELEPATRRFQPTFFRAALDAAAGRFWEPEPLGYQEPRRWTQIRHLDRACRWLGLGSDLSVEERHRQAEALGVETLLLTDASVTLAGWRDRGRAVTSVLARLPEGACLLDRLLEAGVLAGYWGPPFCWDAGIGQLREVVFRTPVLERRRSPM
jgi:hypothetical protein